jgi:protein adenylyltransferase
MRELSQVPLDNAYSRLPQAFYRRVQPTPLRNARLVALDPVTAGLLGLDSFEPGVDPERAAALTALLQGERSWPGVEPLAQVYAGHQFGVYVPRLGDGRALLLGEAKVGASSYDLHLKGAGPTPYSRQGDGRAVLRSTIREYLASVALQGLGIPTTHALCVIASDHPVYRETPETGALLLRVAQSHVRFGTFEYFCHSEQHAYLRALLEFSVERDFPSLASALAQARRDCPAPAEAPLDLRQVVPCPDLAVAFFAEVVRRTAHLVGEWQAVGFCHGVLNSDNCSVLGLTLDHGPFGFLDDFDLDHVSNQSDKLGRYRFERQPDVQLWNLGRLAAALVPLVDPALSESQSREPGGLLHLPLDKLPGPLLEVLDGYGPALVARYLRRMSEKLGLVERDENSPDLEPVEAEGSAELPLSAGHRLVGDLVALLDRGHVDHASFWRRLGTFDLAEWDPKGEAFPEPLTQLFPGGGPFRPWLQAYQEEVARRQTAEPVRRDRMQRVNPAVILRNSLAQAAIEGAEAGDFASLRRLAAALRRPCDPALDESELSQPPPPEGKGLPVSCSS